MKGAISVANQPPTELTNLAIERITRVVRSLADDRVDRGVDLARPMHCDSCDQEKPSAGSAVYGAYKFCNDCLLDFTLKLASGEAGTAAEYMTRRSDGGTFAPDLSLPREHRSGSISPLPARDKLMPRNEPC
ncbi:MAG: hypothetical protein ACR2GA_06130 [Chloroflexota bacterium]